MKKNLLMSLLVITSFSTMFGSVFTCPDGYKLLNNSSDTCVPIHGLGNGALVNPGVGPVITGANVSGKTIKVPARVAERYAQVLQDGQMSCSKVKASSTSGLVHFNDAGQQKAYDRALRDLQKYYGLGVAQANCYALRYVNSIN